LEAQKDQSQVLRRELLPGFDFVSFVSPPLTRVSTFSPTKHCNGPPLVDSA
jgi:hypothetical protein